MHTVCNMIRRATLLATLALAMAPALALAEQPGVQHLHFKFGPINIVPGQNTIDLTTQNVPRPPGPGWITSFSPNLKYPNGTVPRVDVVHLHHGVWLVDGYPTYAAGEEKTIVKVPDGFGYRYDPSQKWWLNYMIHNLTPTPTQVYLTYDMDFIPDGAPGADQIVPVRTKWLDVAGIAAYPVFNVLKGQGRKKGEYTFPTDSPSSPAIGAAQKWTVDHDTTLVGTTGHLHPGGLHTDMYVTRDGQTVHIFRSDAHYFEPAGAVSWDVAMVSTPPNWRVLVKKGDVVSITGTYEDVKASWYESMAIMPALIADGDHGGVDPFTTNVDVPGVLNHGHLPENNNHGGAVSGLPDARGMISGYTSGGPVNIKGFLYGRGDLSLTGKAGRPPTVKVGQSLTFRNLDPTSTVFHTITGCKAPCNRTTGIAYPLANGPKTFDSGELGFGPKGFTPASNRDTWTTPKNLPVGTYTYFCRIHPFMRGAFRVVR